MKKIVKQLIVETFRAIIWFIMIVTLLLFLSSCVDNAPEPITEYTFTVEKDCQSCYMVYWINQGNKVSLNEKVAYRSSTDVAYSGDTLNIWVVNVAGGVNNNILYPVKGTLYVTSVDTMYEVNLGEANYRQLQHILK